MRPAGLNRVQRAQPGSNWAEPGSNWPKCPGPRKLSGGRARLASCVRKRQWGAVSRIQIDGVPLAEGLLVAQWMLGGEIFRLAWRRERLLLTRTRLQPGDLITVVKGRVEPAV